MKKQKVVILGCCGAGKSTLAKKLASVLSLPIIHLDQEYWRPGWVETPKHIWEEKVKLLVQKPIWIMDGNYGGTLHLRLPTVDTIIYLDKPTWLCLFRIYKRYFQYRKKARPDMIKENKERINWQFFYYVATFNFTRRKKLISQIMTYSPKTDVFILQNKKQEEAFLKTLSNPS